jgi:hypothetical protein|tara:strand:- start:149 stop:343 length:195 start_codon:yes stop_codon:yes gene_type:complete
MKEYFNKLNIEQKLNVITKLNECMNINNELLKACDDKINENNKLVEKLTIHKNQLIEKMFDLQK